MTREEVKTGILLNENLNEDLCFEFTSRQLFPADHHRFILVTTQKGRQSLSQAQRACFQEIIEVPDFHSSTLISCLQPLIHALTLENTRILGYDEEVLSVAAELRKHFGIPGDLPENLSYFLNKIEMKEKLKNSRICHPRYCHYQGDEFARSPDDYVTRLIDHLNLPIFAKPTDGTASIGTLRIDTREALFAWCVKHQQDTNFELDEYITGEFYSCNSIILNGEIKLSDVTQYLNPSHDYLLGKPRGSLTLPAYFPVVQEIIKLNREILLHLLPPKDCITHMEVFRRNTGEFVFIEIAARPPGSGISKLYETRIGINLQKIYLMMQMDLQPDIQARHGAYAAVIYFPPRAGVVSDIFQLTFRSQHQIRWRMTPGSPLKNPASILDEACQIFLSNENFDELQRDFLKVHDMIPYAVVEPGMLYAEI